MNKTTDIEELIKKDLETFLYYKSRQKELSVEDAIEIASYVAANFLRIIYAKNKELKPEELNGVFGIISNVYNELFADQFKENDYRKITSKASELLSDTNFDANSKKFFSDIISNK